MYSNKNMYQGPVHRLFLFLLVFLLAAVAGQVRAQTAITIIKGSVTDAVTQEPLIGVSVFLSGTSVGTTTDVAGKFQLRTNQATANLQFSYLGYKTVTRPLRPGQEQVLHVQLETDARQLGEVVIMAKKHYSNKDNPAVDLIRAVVANKNSNRPEQYDFVEYEQYEKMRFSLVSTPGKLKKNLLLRKYPFITSNLDTTVLKGRALLPFYIQEEISSHYYRKTPERRQTVVKASKKVDFGEYIDNKGFTAFLKHMYQEIDLYDNNILLLTNQFLSPIADMAPAFYRYYLRDTITTASGQQLTRLEFEPRNPAAFMFTGSLYITLDGTYAVQSAAMEVARGVGINWVRGLDIALDFERNPDGRYHLQKSRLRADFGLTQSSDAGFYGLREVSYKNYLTDKPQPDSLEEQVARAGTAQVQSPDYWAANRHDSLSRVEAATYTNLDSLVHLSSYRKTMDWATALIAGYKRLGPGLEIGPINTFYSFNSVEGFRLRFGGRTTTNFSKKLMLETYAAFGFKDEKWKYYLGGTWSLTGRSIFEFPVRSIRASYQQDTQIPGQELQFVQEDNFLLSFKRGENNRMLYNQTYRIDYLHEFENHFSYQLRFRNWRQSPAGSLQYLPAGGPTDDTGLLTNQSLTTSEASLELRWAPNEQFFQGKLYRTPVAGRYPVFTLRATAGIKGLFNSQYEYQHLVLNSYKRFNLSQLGYSDVVLEGGYTFGQVPFPLLTIHRANQTYSYQLQSYNLMNFLEFVSDQYASIHIDHTFNGFIFNKVPLLKQTKLREFVTLKVLYGKVRDENQPGQSPHLLRFPVSADGRPATFTLEDKPYMEASVGVGNIFKFFRLDLVKRLTYLDHPQVSKIGLRGRVKFDF